MVKYSLIAAGIIGLCALTCIHVLGSAGTSPGNQAYPVLTSSPQPFDPKIPAGTGTPAPLPSKPPANETGNKISSDLLYRLRTTGSGTNAGGVPLEDDRVYVYIHVIPAVSTHIIDPYVLNVTDRDEVNHIAVAWVNISRLDDLASLPEVRLIQEVLPPRNRLTVTGTLPIIPSEAPTTPAHEQTTSAGSKQPAPTQAPGSGVPLVCGMLALLVVIKKTRIG